MICYVFTSVGPTGEFNGDLTNTASLQLDPAAGTDYSGYPYPFGMDPVIYKKLSNLYCSIFEILYSFNIEHFIRVRSINDYVII